MLETLTADTLQGSAGALHIASFAIVAPEIKFLDATLQILARHMVERTH